MVQYWNGTGVNAGLSVEDGAILATAYAAAAMESITAAGGRELAMENYKEELGLYAAPPEERVVRVMDTRQQTATTLVSCPCTDGTHTNIWESWRNEWTEKCGSHLHETKSETPAKPDRAIPKPSDMLL